MIFLRRAAVSCRRSNAADQSGRRPFRPQPCAAIALVGVRSEIEYLRRHRVHTPTFPRSSSREPLMNVVRHPEEKLFHGCHAITEHR
jgi:hypothetical protein